jgi:hypothetical protein
MNISCKDSIESIFYEGNPLLNDDKFTRELLMSTFRNLKRINGLNVHGQDYNALSPSSQATTGGCGGYSQSLQNIPEMLKELSTFSQTMKPSTDSKPSGQPMI